MQKRIEGIYKLNTDGHDYNVMIVSELVDGSGPMMKGYIPVIRTDKNDNFMIGEDISTIILDADEDYCVNDNNRLPTNEFFEFILRYNEKYKDLTMIDRTLAKADYYADRLIASTSCEPTVFDCQDEMKYDCLVRPNGNRIEENDDIKEAIREEATKEGMIEYYESQYIRPSLGPWSMSVEDFIDYAEIEEEAMDHYIDDVYNDINSYFDLLYDAGNNPDGVYMDFFGEYWTRMLIWTNRYSFEDVDQDRIKEIKEKLETIENGQTEEKKEEKENIKEKMLEEFNKKMDDLKRALDEQMKSMMDEFTDLMKKIEGE